MKYVIIVTTMRTRKARFDRNGTDQLNTLKRKETKMLSNAKQYTHHYQAPECIQEHMVLIIILIKK